MPDRDCASPFFMPIESVVTKSGRGTVITGRVERGVLREHEAIEIIGRRESEPLTAIVTSIESFREEVPEAIAGHNVGLLLRGIERGAVTRGQVAIAPGSLAAYRGGEAEIFLLEPREGGRKSAFAPGYAPVFFFGATHSTGRLDFDAPNIGPGDRASVRFRLEKPVALAPGMRFAMRDGGRTIGAGVVKTVSG
jgi:elongation factor Tu